jgi:predicted metal-dependent phosphoesterase TrpH
MNNQKGLLDFHTHSIHSDGTLSPSGLVREAKQHRIAFLALTDHNVVDGLDEFNSACQREGIHAVPFGVEIYAELPIEMRKSGENEAPDLVVLGKNPRKEVFHAYHEILANYRRTIWIPQTIEALRKLWFEIPQVNALRATPL